MKSAPAIMATRLAREMLSRLCNSPVAENHLHQPGRAGRFERGHFVVERLPVAFEHVRALDDHVDFVRAGFDRAVNLRDALLQRREAFRKIGGNRRHLDSRALQFVQRRLNEGW